MKRLLLILHYKILVIVGFEVKCISSKFYFWQKSREKFQLFDYTLKTHLTCFQNRSLHDAFTVQIEKHVFALFSSLWSYGMRTKMNFQSLFSGFRDNMLWVKDKLFSFKNYTVLKFFFFTLLTPALFSCRIAS